MILLWCLVSQYPASDGSDWNEWNLEQTSIAADQSRQLVALTGAKVIDEKVDERMEIHLTPKDGSVIKLCLAVSHDMLAAGLVEAMFATFCAIVFDVHFDGPTRQRNCRRWRQWWWK